MKKVIGIVLILLMFGSNVFAEMPDKTVVIRNKAFSLNYANDIKNKNEIRKAISNAKKIYIKVRGIWYKNDGTTLEDISVIPEVIYKDKNGQVKYAIGDGEKIIEEQDQATTEKNTDDVFKREDIRDITDYDPTWGFVAKDGELFFSRENGIQNHSLDTSFNPNIKGQVYETIKTLIDKDHYVNVIYNTNTSVIIRYGKTLNGCEGGYTLFDMVFAEKEPLGKYFFAIDLKSLFWDEEERVVKFYSDKLKNSLTGAFGEETGEEIFNYMLEKYLEDFESEPDFKGKDSISEFKQFNNIQVEYVNEKDGSTDFFYFRYIN